MNEPLVSILIPAFRPDWLDISIASALAQTYENIEVLISDDCPTQDVQQVVCKWHDLRIRYMRNPKRGVPGANRDHLISQSTGDYIKFLFDDDFLLPRSVEILLKGCLDFNARLSFHSRHIVDEKGKVTESPTCISGTGYAALSRSAFFGEIIKKSNNVIGEPSNTLIHAATLKSMSSPFGIEGRRMRFLTDVALYSNFSAQGYSIVGCGEFGSAFRRHTQQTSNGKYPGFSAALYEWELLRRWATHKGLMHPADYITGIERQKNIYTNWQKFYPELGAFLQIQDEFSNRNFINEAFVEALQLADCTIAMRILGELSAPV